MLKPSRFISLSTQPPPDPACRQETDRRLQPRDSVAQALSRLESAPPPVQKRRDSETTRREHHAIKSVGSQDGRSRLTTVSFRREASPDGCTKAAPANPLPDRSRWNLAASPRRSGQRTCTALLFCTGNRRR